MSKTLTDDEFILAKELMVDRLITLHHFKSETVDGREYISMTKKGLDSLAHLITTTSKLILKQKVEWVSLLTLDQLFVEQTEMLKLLFGMPEQALLHLATENEVGGLEDLAKDLILLLEPDLIDIEPRSNTIH